LAPSISRLLAIDPDRVADDLAVVEDDPQFRFGNVPVGIASDPDGLAGADRSARRRLEEQLRAVGFVRVRVHLGERALVLPGRLADLIADPRPPHLLGDDR
jgi:hypothetical protein